ncbi:MAG: hypothetical protein ACD_76C00109G0003 [uncultured bacterium]|nr:MAG: hypothetical protein ACD_76C00109G0003 [uncultured bacterium]HBD04927.1 hypothetical protein [Candidatus Uhrbacteria bacterium]
MNLRYGSVIGLVILVLDVAAIIEILRGSMDRASKLLWVLLVLLFPLVGLIIYYFFGRK